MLLPLPFRGGAAEELAHRRRIATDGIHQCEDLRARAPGLGHLRDFQPPGVAVDDFIEQLHLAASPRVNRLLAVAHDEHGPVPAAGRLVDERQQPGPVGAAGVLEFVQQPVLMAGVEPEIHGLAAIFRLAALGPLAHQRLHIVES